MKCSGSPTTFTARNNACHAGSPSGATNAAQQRAFATSVSPQRAVAIQFEGLLWQQAFAPLAKALGFYGDAVVATTSQSLARSERGGLGDLVESALRDDVSRATVR